MSRTTLIAAQLRAYALVLRSVIQDMAQVPDHVYEVADGLERQAARLEEVAEG